MGILDNGVNQDEFEEFKRRIESRIDSLATEIRQKETDSEAQAKEAAENTISIHSTVKNLEKDIQAVLNELKAIKSGADEEYSNISETGKNIKSDSTNLQKKIKLIQDLVDEITTKKESLDKETEKTFADIATINTILEECKSLPESLKLVQESLEESKELKESIDSLQKHSTTRKSEIDSLYKKIQGEDVKNKDGSVEHVDGLKDELDKSYTNIEENLNSIQSRLDTTIKNLVDHNSLEMESKKMEFDKLLSKSRSRYDQVNGQLTSLLPGAMAEGLSAAYEKKKEEEIQTQSKLESSFKNSIKFLVLISLIPFVVDTYLVAWKGINIIDVMKDTLNLLVAILPLYLPVLWFAYSSNKKLNLSKRLIEEYTHKSVLGKTFDGLSNQIESLPKGGVRNELRTRLLFNLLQVSSENPGKLITNYDKSDHPLMEALENSSKLSDSIEVLSRIPGFSSLASRLANRQKDILASEGKRIESGFASQDVIEDNETSNA